MELPDVNVYDDIQRRQYMDTVEVRVREMWFRNYETNRSAAVANGGIDRMPSIKRAIVVGAGFTLDRNLSKIADADVPIIVCDKAAARVADFAIPFAVTALNTQETHVADWLHDFRVVMERKWGQAYRDVWLVVPVTVHPKTLEEWGGRIAFVNPLNTCDELITTVELETGIPPMARGDNVGYFSVIVAVALGADDVAFMGMPYSYRTEGEVLKVTDGWHVVKLRDVTKDYVYTTLDWIDARREFVNFCRDAQEQAGVRFYNASEGGILYQPGIIRAVKLEAWRSAL